MEKDKLLHKEILRGISSGVIYLQKGEILYVNSSTLKILCKTEEELVGKTFVEAFLGYKENDDFVQMLLEVIYDDTHEYEKIVQYFTGKEIKTLHVKTSSIYSKKVGIVMLIDDLTELVKLRVMVLDFEEIKKINQQLSELKDYYKRISEVDKLTGLLNKITFENICKERIKHLLQNELAAFFVIDLDYFKEINDTFGHQFGDEILKAFSVELKNIFYKESFIGRFGGDEFVIYLEKVSDKNFVIEQAKKICKAAVELKIGEKKFKLSASVGVVIFNGIENDYTKIFETADQSVYIVKTMGKNGFNLKFLPA